MRHPKTGMPYDAMVYQPMLELLSYLRDESFRTFIVSGDGIDFIRVLSEDSVLPSPSSAVRVAAPT